MIRNIPSECIEEALFEEWPADGTYDFFYLPRNAGGKANLGYCFINFVSEAAGRLEVEGWSWTSNWSPRGRSAEKGRRERRQAVGIAGRSAVQPLWSTAAGGIRWQAGGRARMAQAARARVRAGKLAGGVARARVHARAGKRARACGLRAGG